MHLKSETTLHSDMDNLRAGHQRDLGEFNAFLTCRICLGYMIDPTTVDYCYHTYCRSCILKHLLRDVYCPQCKGSGGKQINEDNLRSDDTLRAFIYKLVPGLYQRECDRLVEFEEQHRDLDAGDVLKKDKEQEFFTSAEPISLSLEYHPAMLKKCRLADKPPVYYLQCPAGLRVVHLKRFLCSKHDIDAENKQVEVEVTYEDEVLPPSFTLMDVGYCYQWNRHAPMAFRYRILLYESGMTKNDENNLSKVNQDIELSSGPAAAAAAALPTKSSKTVTFADDVLLPSQASKTRSKSNSKVSKGKRTTGGSKREPEDATALSNFKSLRSNDMRYSDYGVSSSSSSSSSSCLPPLLRVKSEPEPEEQSSLGVSNNLNIVVSIPPSQLSKVAAYVDEGFELKTANKKSPPNLPKLKIELNSMKAKLTMPKSADARLEDVQQQLDLETYAKNIGLKPIEPPAAVAAATDILKYSPNASPMSSGSSSTNGSNGSTVDFSTSTSSSSHRKRKKKHSKEPKDSNGKRKKLHAEISSQTDGKMKMKITTTHNHKAHKLDLKRSHSLAGGELVSLKQLQLAEEQQPRPASKESELNRTLGEESRSINNLMTGSKSEQPIAKEKELNLPASPPLPPSLFKAFSHASSAPVTTPAAPAAATIVARPKPAVAPLPQPLPQQPLTNNNNRKPTLTPCATPTSTPHFVVPQAPLRQAPHNMQRYHSTPTSIASAANKQPKRSLSLDETQAQQQKHPRLDYQLQLQQQQQQLSAKYAAAAKLKASSYTPQMRLYGPELVRPTQPGSMPMLCPTSMNLNLGLPTASSSVTITPRPRNTLSYAPFPESSSLNNLPALEIMRRATAATVAGAACLMGPPVSLPKQPARRAEHSPPMNMPAMVKSPPLSVALSGQRGSNNRNSNNNGNNNNRNNNNNSNNAAYRTSPPALINLRNTVPLAFPSKSVKAEVNTKKTTTVAAGAAAGVAAAAAAATAGKTNGITALDKSKTSLREFRPPFVPATSTTATTTTTVGPTTVAAKDADILDLSAGRSSSSNSSNSSSAKQTTTATGTTKLAPKSPPVGNSNSNNNSSSSSSSSSSSNSLEAALNKIKQNISANSNNTGGTAATAAAAAAGGGSGGGGDDLQNLHMLSESATAREKISISISKAGSNIYENKPKNALVRPQNASVRSIPNPSALAFRNQANLLTNSSNTTATAPAAAAPTTATVAVTAGATATIAAKPLTVKAEEKTKLSATTATLLSPNNNNNNNNSSNNNNNAATSPRAVKKATTIDQVAANLNIRAEAKAAALAEEAPLAPLGSSVAAAKTPELEKAAASSSNTSKTLAKEPTATAATPTVAAAAAAATTATLSSLTSDAHSKPPVQISATDTLAPVASSA